MYLLFVGKFESIMLTALTDFPLVSRLREISSANKHLPLVNYTSFLTMAEKNKPVALLSQRINRKI
jgi:hypothetical protein